MGKRWYCRNKTLVYTLSYTRQREITHPPQVAFFSKIYSPSRNEGRGNYATTFFVSWNFMINDNFSNHFSKFHFWIEDMHKLLINKMIKYHFQVAVYVSKDDFHSFDILNYIVSTFQKVVFLVSDGFNFIPLGLVPTFVLSCCWFCFFFFIQFICQR